MAIIVPGTNSIQPRRAGVICCDLLQLLKKRKLGRISRKVFLVSWSRLRRELERTPEYQQFRQTVLERDAYRCRSCGRVAHIVHHRRRVAMAVHLVLEPRNGEVRCSDCHKDKHPHLRKTA